jgi:hypothetical protein
MDRAEIIANLTDDQATKCLNCMLKDFAEREGDLAQVITSDAPAAITTIASRVLDDADAERLGSIRPDDPRMVKLILRLMAGDKRFAERLDGCLARRDTLIEPITTAIVMAGLVILLSTHVKISYENKQGKKHLKVFFEKTSTPKEILKKILGVL